MEIQPAVRQRRKEIRVEAKRILLGKVLYHPYFPHDIYINVSGIKEWLNQPHKHYAEKNEALLQLPELLLNSEYLGAKPDETISGTVTFSKQPLQKKSVGLSSVKPFGESAWCIAFRTITPISTRSRISEPFPPELQSDAVFRNPAV